MAKIMRVASVVSAFRPKKKGAGADGDGGKPAAPRIHTRRKSIIRAAIKKKLADAAAAENGGGDGPAPERFPPLPWVGQIDTGQLASIHNAVGLVYNRRGDYQRALEHLTAAIFLNSQHERAFFNRGPVCAASI